MTKEEVIGEIAALIGVANPGAGAGSSVPKVLFDQICQKFGIDAAGSMPQQAQAIVSAARIPYNFLSSDSRGTVSGGGSTVTLEGLLRIKQAVEVLLAR